MNRIAEIARHERPRERLAQVGPRALNDTELVAILLGTGAPGKGAPSLAGELLADFNGLGGLASVSFDELAARHGLGPAKASRLLTAIELGRRAAARPSGAERPRIGTPEDVERMFGAEMASLPQEHVRVLLLDARSRLIRAVPLYVGAADHAPVRLAEVFRPAVAAGARQIILVHNHPSGDPTPSQADVALTRAAHQVGRALGIELVDHLVLAAGGMASLRRLGLGFCGPEPDQPAPWSSTTARARAKTRRTTRSG